MLNTIIRPAILSDAENLLNFFKKVGLETDFLMMDENGVSMNTDEEIEHLKQYENQQYGLYLVAINENGDIVGQSAITQDYPNRKKAQHIYSLGICILKDYWGQGIASQMMTQLINHAKQIGCKRLDLYVITTNITAISLYKKFGFEIEGTLKKCNKVDGKYQNEYIMALIFDN